MTDDTETDDSTEPGTTLYTLEAQTGPNGAWEPVDTFTDGDKAKDALLDRSPARLETERVCGAETADGGVCRNHPESCPVENHE